MKEAIMLSLCLIVLIVQAMRLILDYLKSGIFDPFDISITALILIWLVWLIL